MADTERKPRDWWLWHQDYDVPGSPLHRRTEVVHRRVRAFLDSCGSGPVQIVSACAGQGRELLPVLAAHPRRTDVRARLVELDPRNVAAACEAVSELRLDWNVEIVCGDASVTDAYVGAVPADLVLLCGVFGCISRDDVRSTIGYLPELCAAGATVIWSCQRGKPDRRQPIRTSFDQAGFREETLESPDAEASWVGVHRFEGDPRPLTRGGHLFTFRRGCDR
jgi:hypothetical protein